MGVLWQPTANINGATNQFLALPSIRTDYPLGAEGSWQLAKNVCEAVRFVDSMILRTLQSLLPGSLKMNGVLTSAGIFESSNISGLEHLLKNVTRGYKSNKKSMKPLNTKASWLAVKPFLPPLSAEEVEHRQRFKRAPIVDTCIPPLPTVDYPTFWTKVGKIVGPYSLETQRCFAVVEIGGTQHKVTADDIIFVNILHGPEVNEVISLDRVMMLGSRYQTIIGRPYLSQGRVIAAVEEHFKDGKIHVFKMKRRKHYRIYKGHRTHYTTLRILQVQGIAEESDNDTAPQLNIPMELYSKHDAPTVTVAQ